MSSGTMPEGEGGCLCGVIRYSFSGPPLLTALCHCKNCQRQSGSAFSLISAVPAASFRQQGVTKVFNDIGESGSKVARHFCPECGAPIVSIAEALPDLILIKAGTMDDTSGLAPSIEVFCDSAMRWVDALPGAQRFARSNI